MSKYPYTYIYSLIDPLTEEIRYIGKTVNPVMRYCHHFSSQELSFNTYKNKWIKNLMDKNVLPYMNIIAKCKNENANTKEKYYISFFKNKGLKLTNGTEGGDGWPANKPMIGKHKKGNEQTHQYKKVKAVNKLNHNEILYFDAVKIAAKKLNIPKGNISECLRKILKSAGGYHWFYFDESIIIPTYHIPKKIKATNIKTGEIIKFDSGFKAKKFHCSTIHRACKGNAYGIDGHYYKGYRWEHY